MTQIEIDADFGEAIDIDLEQFLVIGMSDEETEELADAVAIDDTEGTGEPQVPRLEPGGQPKSKRRRIN